MANKKSTLLNMVVVLTAVSVIVGAALGYIYKITKEPIEQANIAAQENAIRMVAPEFDNSPSQESYEVTTAEGLTVTVFPATKGGEPVGAAVRATSQNGFSGEIAVMVGFDNEGNILNYSVLSHAETPGLGSKMNDWFRTDKNRQSVLGKNPGNCNLTVTKDGGEIDAITAATISSRAFLETLRNAYEAYKGQNTDATSGSSVHTTDANSTM